MLLFNEAETERSVALAALAQQHDIHNLGLRPYSGGVPGGILAYLQQSAIAKSLDPAGAAPSAVAWVREMAYTGTLCATTAHLMMTQSMPMHALALAGERQCKAAQFDALMGFEKIGCFCLTEPGGGTDAGNLATVATPATDGYRITGEKCMIMNAHSSRLFLVAARMQGMEGYGGITLFLLEGESKGLTVSAPQPMMGLDGVPLCNVHMEDVFVPAACRVGAEGGGWPILMQVLDRTRPAVGAYCVGMGKAALRMALDYTRQRAVFGKPLLKFQNTTNRLADNAIALEAAWLLVRQAAAHIDTGAPVSALSAAAKLAASEAAQKAADDALQMFGGYGYLQQTGIERLLRDLRVARIYDGANEVLRDIVAGGASRALA